jgi:hypothetical protein
VNRDRVVVHQALLRSMPPNGRAFSGERTRATARARVRCNAMLGTFERRVLYRFSPGGRYVIADAVFRAVSVSSTVSKTVV